MSKIYNKYLELKEENKDILYLFHTGKFYIFIAGDADIINEYVVLKKTKFTNEVDKCGFPEERFENYMHVFKNHDLTIEVIEAKSIIVGNKKINDEMKLKKYQKIEKCINSIEINNITPLQALEKLAHIKRCFDE